MYGKQNVGSMSARQQLLYIMQISQQGNNVDWDNTDENPNQNYNVKFEQNRKQMREKDIYDHPERWRMLAHSLSQFVPIKKNRFLERNKYILHPNEYQSFACSCQPSFSSLNNFNNQQSFDCGSLCLNRSVNQDCVPKVCPVGSGCRNRRFQLHQNAYVYPVKTENKGWGLAAGEFIKEGTFIMQYVGEVFHVDSEIGKKRQEKYKNSTCTYMMRTENGEVIDPTYYGNIARFINHSCEPNCVTRKWTVFKETSVGIFARRDIQENEELSFDYQFDSFKTPFTKCYCGVPKCKGYLGLGMYEDGEDQVNAPICKHCSKLVKSEEQLLVCRGPCREVFHVDCAAIKDKNIKSKEFNKRKYVCKPCIYKETGKKKPGRKSRSELLMLEEQDEDKPDEAQMNSFPVEQDSETQKFIQSTPENLLLDKVIRREIFQIDTKQGRRQDDSEAEIESDAQMSDDLQERRPTRSKKKRQVFSEFYNFMFELQKRLKQRMRENQKNFKFRKPKDAKAKPTRPRKRVVRASKSEDAKPTADQEMEEVKSNSHESGSVSKTSRSKSIGLSDQSPRSVQESREDEMSQSLDSDNSLAEEQGEDEMISNNFSQTSLSDKQSHYSSNSSMSQDSESQSKESASDRSMISQSSRSSVSPASSIKSQKSDRSSSPEQYDEKESSASASKLETAQLGLVSESQEPQAQPEPSEPPKKKRPYRRKTAEEKAEIERQKKERAEKRAQAKLLKQLAIQEKNQRRKRLQTEKQMALQRMADKLAAEPSRLKTPERLKGSWRKGSFGKDSGRKSSRSRKESIDSISKLFRDRIQAFLDQQLELEEQGVKQVTKTSKFNIYEQVFNLVINDNMDLLECVPDLQMYWDGPWGRLVTLTVISSQCCFKTIFELLQKATDTLQSNDLLTEASNTLHPTSNHGFRVNSATGQSVEPVFVLPFLIQTMMVPKNFIKKLVGYQEKVLNLLKKKYEVNFDYDDKLVTDFVFLLDETSPLYVYGKGKDVVKVCKVLQQELDKLVIRTLCVSKEESKFILDNIKEFKSLIDPCEIRVKRYLKDKGEIKHPLFLVPNTQREMCLIGNIQEIEQAEKKLYEFYSYRIDAPDLTKTNLCWLLPLQLRSDLREIKDVLFKQNPQVLFTHFDPSYPRKHLTLYMSGPWNQMIKAKETLIQLTDDKLRKLRQPTFKSFESFQEYAYHKQLRFAFKILKRVKLENSYNYLSHWDTCSSYVENAGLNLERESSQPVKKSPEIKLQKAQDPRVQQQAENKSTSLLSRLFGGQQVEAPQVYTSQKTPGTQKSIEQEINEEIIEKQRLEDYRHKLAFEQYNALVEYLKVHDSETCINALFVLANVQNSLESLMIRLQLGKESIIQMAEALVKECIKELNLPSFSSYLNYKNQKLEQKIKHELLRQMKEDRASKHKTRIPSYYKEVKVEKTYRPRRSSSKDYSPSHTHKLIKRERSRDESKVSSPYRTIDKPKLKEHHSIPYKPQYPGYEEKVTPRRDVYLQEEPDPYRMAAQDYLYAQDPQFTQKYSQPDMKYEKKKHIYDRKSSFSSHPLEPHVSHHSHDPREQHEPQRVHVQVNVPREAIHRPEPRKHHPAEPLHHHEARHHHEPHEPRHHEPREPRHHYPKEPSYHHDHEPRYSNIPHSRHVEEHPRDHHERHHERHPQHAVRKRSRSRSASYPPIAGQPQPRLHSQTQPRPDSRPADPDELLIQTRESQRVSISPNRRKPSSDSSFNDFDYDVPPAQRPIAKLQKVRSYQYPLTDRKHKPSRFDESPSKYYQEQVSSTRVYKHYEYRKHDERRYDSPYQYRRQVSYPSHYVRRPYRDEPYRDSFRDYDPRYSHRRPERDHYHEGVSRYAENEEVVRTVEEPEGEKGAAPQMVIQDGMGSTGGLVTRKHDSHYRVQVGADSASVPVEQSEETSYNESAKDHAQRQRQYVPSRDHQPPSHYQSSYRPVSSSREYKAPPTHRPISSHQFSHRSSRPEKPFYPSYRKKDPRKFYR